MDTHDRCIQTAVAVEMLRLAAVPELAPVDWGCRRSRASVTVAQVEISHLLQLLFCHVESKAIIVRLQVRWLNGDILPPMPRKLPTSTITASTEPERLRSSSRTLPMLRF